MKDFEKIYDYLQKNFNYCQSDIDIIKTRLATCSGENLNRIYNYLENKEYVDVILGKVSLSYLMKFYNNNFVLAVLGLQELKDNPYLEEHILNRFDKRA